MITIKEITTTPAGYRPTLEERETIIHFDEAGNNAEVFTFNLALIRKLDALAEERPDEVTITRAEAINGIQCREYRLPKKWIKVNASRILSEDEKARLSERGRRLAENRLFSDRD